MQRSHNEVRWIQLRVRGIERQFILLTLAEEAGILAAIPPDTRNLVLFHCTEAEFERILETTQQIDACLEWIRGQALEALLNATGAELPTKLRKSLAEATEQLQADPHLQRLIVKAFGSLSGAIPASRRSQ